MRGNGSSRGKLEERASVILERGVILHLGMNRFRVSSQSRTDRYYDVSFLDAWRCTCPYHSAGRGDCKHIIAVQGLVMKVPKLKPAGYAMEEQDVACAGCGSADTRHFETHDTLRGKSKRYKCRGCGKRFTLAPGILSRHYPMGVVTGALEDVATGKSLNAASRGLKKRAAAGGGDDRAPDPSAIWGWMKYAVDTVGGVTKKLPVRTGSKWGVDEIFFKSAGRGRWSFGVMDTESRFMIARDTADNKMGYNAADLLKDAVDTAGKRPAVLVSDCLDGFKKGFKAAIARRNGGNGTPPVHIHSAAIRKRHVNNNLYERQNGNIKDRIKTARGFDCDDPPLLGLHAICHNFVWSHMGLDMKAPAEVIGIRIRGTDKRATLLAYAAACST